MVANPTVAVITPTTGSVHLVKAIESITNQTYSNIIHYLIIDGEKFADVTLQSIRISEKLKVIVLPFNTGSEGFNGHRIYAASSYIINEDYFFFLDEDNWYDNDHVSSMMDVLLNSNLDWVYSFRKIFGHSGTFITKDNCESLGNYKPYSGFGRLVDTNCYALKKQTMIKNGGAWYHPRGADRNFFRTLIASGTKYVSSGLYTVNYRLHEKRPPGPLFFINGNNEMMKRYKGKLPWIST